jgi:hypothetical protein
MYGRMGDILWVNVVRKYMMGKWLWMLLDILGGVQWQVGRYSVVD